MHQDVHLRRDINKFLVYGECHIHNKHQLFGVVIGVPCCNAFFLTLSFILSQFTNIRQPMLKLKTHSFWLPWIILILMSKSTNTIVYFDKHQLFGVVIGVPCCNAFFLTLSFILFQAMTCISNGCVPLLRQPVIPTTHYSNSPLLRRPIFPTMQNRTPLFWFLCAMCTTFSSIFNFPHTRSVDHNCLERGCTA
jgi:hypothetical protein